MSEIKNISVLAVGNPAGNAGVGPIVMYNNPQFNVENDTHGGLGDNDYYFSVKIDNNYTIYKLIKNNVRSLQAVRGGYLAIAFSIPRGYELVSTNPYQVLMELWKTFRDTCMTLKDSVLHVYEFNTKNIETSILDEIASAYTLKRTNKVYRPMKSNGMEIALVVQPEGKIEELLSDVQYREFSNYREILIAETARNSVKYFTLNDIQIPRPAIFSLVVDGIHKGYITNKHAEIPVRSTQDPTFYENKELKFTISDLLEGKQYDGITIDEGTEQVLVSTSGWAKAKTKKMHLQINPPEGEKYFIRHKDLLQITKNGKHIQLDDNFDFVLTGTEIDAILSFSIISNKEYKKISAKVDGNKIEVDVEKINTPRVAETGINGKFPPQKFRDTEVVKVKIQIKQDIFEEIEDRNLTIRCKVGDKIIQTTDVTFNRSNDGETREGHLFIPKSWIHRHVYLNYTIGHISYDSKQSIDFSKDECCFICDSGQKSNFNCTKCSRITKKMKIFISCLLLFMLGLCTGYGICSSVNKTPSNDDNSEANDKISASTTDSLGTGTESPDLGSEATLFLNSVTETLQNKDVSFDEIHRMDSIYEASYEAYGSYDEDQKVYKKLSAYDTLIICIKQGEVETAKQLASADYISKQHADKVRLLNENNYKVSSFAEIIGQPSSNSSDANDQIVKCEKCGKRVQASQMEAHRLKFHAFICDTCKKKFASQKELKEHLNNCER